MQNIDNKYSQPIEKPDRSQRKYTQSARTERGTPQIRQELKSDSIFLLFNYLNYIAGMRKILIKIPVIGVGRRVLKQNLNLLKIKNVLKVKIVLKLEMLNALKLVHNQEVLKEVMIKDLIPKALFQDLIKNQESLHHLIHISVIIIKVKKLLKININLIRIETKVPI